MSRSFTRIDKEDLARLASVAAADRDDLFKRKPGLARLYQHRVLCVALCQGAALHYVDGKNGIKDFDVWTFYRVHSVRPFPPRRNVPRDLGDAKFGKSPDCPGFIGRCVDCLGRSIPCRKGQEPFEAVREWLRSSRNISARKLAQKAVVILEPVPKRGEVIWP